MVIKSSSPDKDTGWGVIYRLNELFREVENLSPSGDYDKWNFKLDRIWSNLLYKNPLKIEKDENENITSIEFDEDAFRIKTFFDKEIALCKKEMREAKKETPAGQDFAQNKKYIGAKNKLYKLITKKDIWLRKFMQELGLYLKETEYNPAGAMWGK
jgi:hypothetical protein